MRNLLSSLVFALTFLTGLYAQESYKIGSIVDDFNLVNTINGMDVSLSDYKNKSGVIIVFTCNHCPYAQAYEKRIMELSAKYESSFPVIAINPNDPTEYPSDSPDNMKRRAVELDYKFPYLFDETQEIAQNYGALKTPHAFILLNSLTNPGEFTLRYMGAIDDNYQDESAVKVNYIDTTIKELLEGLPVSNAETKAIGCSIKWKK